MCVINEKLEIIGRYEFGAYRVPGGFAVADPVDDKDGFYVTGPQLEPLLDELIAAASMPEAAGL